MNPYFAGILLAFVSPILHGWANIIDSDFSNQIFKRLACVIFFSELVGLVFLPIVIIISPPTLIHSWLIFAMLLACALIEIFYLFPYYWAFRDADTSIVTSLFSLDKLFVPILAYFLVGERLSTFQYLGLVLIVIASVSLNLDLKKHTINRALYLMLGVSVMLAVESVLFKYIFNHGVSWGTAFVWVSGMQFVVASVLLLFPKNQADFKVARRKMNKIGYLFFLEELLSWGGEAASTAAISLIPVSVEQGVSASQPIFVLFYALIFGRAFPKFFKEYTDKHALIEKAAFFVVIILGTLLVIGKGVGTL